MDQPISKYELLRGHMRNLADDTRTQKTRSSFESVLRRWATDKGTDATALVDCAVRDIPLDQALTLANMTRKESDALIDQLTPHLASLVSALLPLSTALSEHDPE